MSNSSVRRLKLDIEQYNVDIKKRVKNIQYYKDKIKKYNEWISDINSAINIQDEQLCVLINLVHQSRNKIDFLLSSNKHEIQEKEINMKIKDEFGDWLDVHGTLNGQGLVLEIDSGGDVNEFKLDVEMAKQLAEYLNTYIKKNGEVE